MVATFVIFLREGIEASMIVAILLAYLDRIGERRHFRAVLTGVGVALGLVLVAGVAVYATITTYAGSRAQTIFETVTYLVAADDHPPAGRGEHDRQREHHRLETLPADGLEGEQP